MTDALLRECVKEVERDLASLESEHHQTSASVRELQSQIKKLSDDLIAERGRRRQLATIVELLAELTSFHLAALDTHVNGERDAEIENCRADASENARR